MCVCVCVSSSMVWQRACTYVMAVVSLLPHNFHHHLQRPHAPDPPCLPRPELNSLHNVLATSCGLATSSDPTS